MILLKPDHRRRIEIPGVPAPVPRPVDIDQSMTGFTALRTLRIYRFAEGSLIEGHAEEDEVLIVVMSGSIDLTTIIDAAEEPRPVRLSAPGGSSGVACAAYLPPHAAYRLATSDGADVAYARATPTGARSPRVFSSLSHADTSGILVLFEETSYAERLRIRLVSFHTGENDLAFAPVHPAEQMCESLIHLRTALPAQSVASITASSLDPTSPKALSPDPISINSWDTVAAMPGQVLTLNLLPRSSGLALIIMAR